MYARSIAGLGMSVKRFVQWDFDDVNGTQGLNREKERPRKKRKTRKQLRENTARKGD